MGNTTSKLSQCSILIHILPKVDEYFIKSKLISLRKKIRQFKPFVEIIRENVCITLNIDINEILVICGKYKYSLIFM